MLSKFQQLFIVFFLFIHGISGQLVTISPDINLKSDDRFQVLGEMGDRILLFMDRSGSIQIEVYETNMTFIRSVPLRLEDNRVRIAGVIPGKNTFSFIYHYRGRKGQHYIKARKYNKDVQLVDSTTVAKYDRIQVNPRILFDVCEDRSKALIFRLVDDRRLETMVVDLWRMKTIWAELFEFEGSLRNSFRQALVNNRGDVFILGEQDRRGFGNRDNYNLELVTYTSDGQLNTGELNISNLRVLESTVQYDNLNHQLICAGLYSEKGSKADGNFIIRVNPYNIEDYSAIKYPFDNALLIDLYGANAPKRNGVDYLEPRDIILRDDGGLVFISEVTKVLNRRGSYNIAGAMPGRSTRWVDYYYEDLVVTSVHPDGDQHWDHVLRKKQYSQDDNGIYSSYFLFSAPSHVRLLYNDEISNNNTVSEYVIAPDGRYDRNSVLSTDYQRLKLIFNKAIQISGTGFIVPSERQSRLNLVKVEYPTDGS